MELWWKVRGSEWGVGTKAKEGKQTNILVYFRACKWQWKKKWWCDKKVTQRGGSIRGAARQPPNSQVWQPLRILRDTQSVKPWQTRGELPEAEWNPGSWVMEKNKAEKGIMRAGSCNLKLGYQGKCHWEVTFRQRPEESEGGVIELSTERTFQKRDSKGEE